MIESVSPRPAHVCRTAACQPPARYLLVLPAAGYAVRGRHMLELAAETSWMGNTAWGRTLVVREAYRALELAMHNWLEQKGGWTFAVRGCEGTAPYVRGDSHLPTVSAHNDPRLLCTGADVSAFGFWLLYRWACERKRVVLQRDAPSPPLLLCSDGVFELDMFSWSREVAIPGVMCVLCTLATHCASPSERSR